MLIRVRRVVMMGGCKFVVLSYVMVFWDRDGVFI